jgi:(E)-4-hydroxy-3-methylbut-2-enyl-diphosphate synthase
MVGPLPAIADIHFQPRYVYAAIDAGCAGVRVSPGSIRISVKHHDPLVTIAAYRELARRCDYPVHLGVTEAGPLRQGTIKSAVAFGVLLAVGIGDTMRVSLSAPVVEEVKVGAGILESLGLRPRQMVNGPGEAREADLGVSSGNGKGQIFVRGEVVRTVPEHRIVEALLEEALQREWGERS